MLAVVDDELGRWMKQFVAAEYNKDFESTRERTNAWTDGLITASERRILVTNWVGTAWRKWKAMPDLILKSFKRMGCYNDMMGREKHLVKVRRMMTY